MIHNFLFMFFLHWIVKIQCNLSVVKMYPCCTEIMCCSQHVCSLDAAFVLFNPIWSMVGLAFSLCCLFLLHGFILLLQTKKKGHTNSTYTNNFFNKESSVFPNLQCASCWFPFIVLPLPCPSPHPPTHPPTSSPAMTKIDDFHASSIPGPEWVYLLSFTVIIFHWVAWERSVLPWSLDASLWPTVGSSSFVCAAFLTSYRAGKCFFLSVYKDYCYSSACFALQTGILLSIIF